MLKDVTKFCLYCLVATEVARCMCGIAVSKSDNGTVSESLLSIATRVICFFLGFSCLRV
jgi:hypothetical protein